MGIIQKNEPPSGSDWGKLPWMTYWLRVIFSYPVRLLATIGFMFVIGVVIVTILAVLIVEIIIGAIAFVIGLVMVLITILALFVLSIGIAISPHDVNENWGSDLAEEWDDE